MGKSHPDLPNTGSAKMDTFSNQDSRMHKVKSGGQVCCVKILNCNYLGIVSIIYKTQLWLPFCTPDISVCQARGG